MGRPLTLCVHLQMGGGFEERVLATSSCFKSSNPYTANHKRFIPQFIEEWEWAKQRV